MNRNPATLTVKVDYDSLVETLNIHYGAFAPLTGFHNEVDYKSIVGKMRLNDGSLWSLPITLEIDESLVDKCRLGGEVRLSTASGYIFATMGVTDTYRIDTASNVLKIFGTEDPTHPGVAKELSRSPFRIGGPVLSAEVPPEISYECTPEQVKQQIERLGWKTVAGFQTRNPPHLAHEYLHRLAMEYCDGVFLHPLIGWKKNGDFTPKAVMGSYNILVDKYYGRSNALLGAFRTAMRYAGPREAVFHALVRKNYGCTHFVIGRDHAGVNNFYHQYEAQEMAVSLDDLGIEILPFKGPYYCQECKRIVTCNTCLHGNANALEVSGTRMRQMLVDGEHPPVEIMRDEISQFLVELIKRKEAFCE